MRPATHIPKATVPFILHLLQVSEEELHAQGIQAKELALIHNDYTTRLQALEDVGLLVANALKRHTAVHAVRYRVKEPLHLLKKIIRKRKEYPDRHLTADNYLMYINDLVGVRLLHLYKNTCHDIGNFITQNWELKRNPFAYVTNKNSEEARQFNVQKYKVIENDRGYRAQHYILHIKPSRQPYFVEVQVKTLFEEGWSEIDHCIRYPDQQPNELLNRLLFILNRLTSDADAVATQIQVFATALQQYKSSTTPETTVAELQARIDKLPVDAQEKQHLYACLARHLR